MKIYLLVICLFTSFILNAQIKKGTMLIGGDASVYGGKTTSTSPNEYTSKNSGFAFSPSIGWAVKDNLVVGGSLLLSFNNNEQQSPVNSNKGNRIGGGLWVRNYQPLGNSFYLFGNAGLNAQSIYNKNTIVQQPYNLKEKGFLINAALTPGVSYQVKKCLFLEVALNNIVSLGFQRTNRDEQSQNGIVYKNSSNSYNLSTSLGSGVPLQIGMRWVRAKKG